MIVRLVLNEPSFGLRVLLLPVSVFVRARACVCVFVPCVCQLQDCPLDDLWLIQARTTKFAQKMQNTKIHIPIVWGTLAFKVKFNWKSKCHFALFTH